MRIVVIGLGSMGKRRIRLLHKYQNTLEIVGVDTNKERRNECENEYEIRTFSSLSTVVDSIHIDCAFICTSPLSHSKLITQCLSSGLHVFTELNLVSDGYDENILLAKQKGLTLFLSSTFLYREEIQKVKSLLQMNQSLFNYTYHVGQYLPDWHPWENYQNFFVGNTRTNGCRELFAIELPWLVDVFGEIVDIKVSKSKISSLNINYDDNYLLLIQHNSGHKGCLAVDVVSRKAVRNLEIYGEQIYLQWDGSPTGLYTYDLNEKKNINIKLYDEVDQLDKYSSFVVENAYLNEIISFFAAVNEKKLPIYDFEKDKSILRMIDQIEE